MVYSFNLKFTARVFIWTWKQGLSNAALIFHKASPGCDNTSDPLLMSRGDNRRAHFQNGNTAANSISAAQGKDQGRRSYLAPCSAQDPPLQAGHDPNGPTPAWVGSSSQGLMVQPGLSKSGSFYILSLSLENNGKSELSN